MRLVIRRAEILSVEHFFHEYDISRNMNPLCGWIVHEERVAGMNSRCTHVHHPRPMVVKFACGDLFYMNNASLPPRSKEICELGQR